MRCSSQPCISAPIYITAEFASATYLVETRPADPAIRPPSVVFTLCNIATMVRLNSFLHLGLCIPAGLARSHGHAAHSAYKNLDAVHSHLSTIQHDARHAEGSAAELDQLFHGLKVARGVLDSQAQGKMVQVSEQNLNDMLKEIKDLEAQVSKMLPGDATAATTASDVDDDDCTPEDMLPLTGGRPAVSGKPLPRRKANCKIGSKVGAKLNANPSAGSLKPMLNNAAGLGPKSLNPLSEPTLGPAKPTLTPEDSSSLPEGVFKEFDEVVVTSTDALGELTTTITLTRTRTRTETIFLANAKSSAESAPSAPSDAHVSSAPSLHAPVPVKNDAAVGNDAVASTPVSTPFALPVSSVQPLKASHPAKSHVAHDSEPVESTLWPSTASAASAASIHSLKTTPPAKNDTVKGAKFVESVPTMASTMSEAFASSAHSLKPSHSAKSDTLGNSDFIPGQTSVAVAHQKVNEVKGTTAETKKPELSLAPAAENLQSASSGTAELGTAVGLRPPVPPVSQTLSSAPKPVAGKADNLLKAATMNGTAAVKAPSGFRTVVAPPARD